MNQGIGFESRLHPFFGVFLHFTAIYICMGEKKNIIEKQIDSFLKFQFKFPIYISDLRNFKRLKAKIKRLWQKKM